MAADDHLPESPHDDNPACRIFDLVDSDLACRTDAEIDERLDPDTAVSRIRRPGRTRRDVNG